MLQLIIDAAGTGADEVCQSVPAVDQAREKEFAVIGEQIVDYTSVDRETPPRCIDMLIRITGSFAPCGFVAPPQALDSMASTPVI